LSAFDFAVCHVASGPSFIVGEQVAQHFADGGCAIAIGGPQGTLNEPFPGIGAENGAA
jgi:hypothetical protein